MSSVLDGENRATPVTALTIEPVSGGWRLCDGAVVAAHAPPRVGGGERVGDALDAGGCTGVRRRQRFARWEDVIAVAERRLVRTESRGRTAPVRIAHLPPPR